MKLGEKLRELRTERNLTLEQAAEAASLSKSYISQLENDKANPSLSSLQAIVAAYGVPLAALFEYSDARPAMTVVRKNQRKAYTLPGSEVIREFLSPDTHRKMEAVLTVAQPGVNSGINPFIHEGEEFGLMLRGRLNIRVGDEHCVLEEGDTVYFNCGLPHSWENAGDTPVETIWVITPPSF